MKFRSRNSFRTELLCIIKKIPPTKPRYCMKKGKEVERGGKGEKGVRERKEEGEREAPFHIRF